MNHELRNLFYLVVCYATLQTAVSVSLSNFFLALTGVIYAISSKCTMNLFHHFPYPPKRGCVSGLVFFFIIKERKRGEKHDT